MSKFVCVFLSLFLAILSTTWGNPPHYVYRGDARDPQLIFQTGMQSWGTCQNIRFHVSQGGRKTSAFISTSSSEFVALGFVKKELNENKSMDAAASVYKIRADQRFFSSDNSLMAASEKYYQEKEAKKAQGYVALAEKYQTEFEWMAFGEIPSALIQQATTYTRQNPTGTVVKNPNYVEKPTYGNQLPFPESTTGCSAAEQLEANNAFDR